ncbi:hypothetical protein K474DRAFT_328840 [Panus rudis PR-1116 ss-1]|nr:hypothetical protein K474DRAFT_328840 [Panus rudis PR-1116 ss-1]
MSCTYSYEQSRFLSRCEKEIPRLASELHDLRQGLREVIKNSYDTRSEIFHNITSALDRIARVEHIWVSLIATYARGSGLLGKRYPTTVNFNWGEQLILATKEGQADVNSISDYLQEDFRDFVESELESNDDVNGEVIESISGGLFALGDLHSQVCMLMRTIPF